MVDGIEIFFEFVYEFGFVRGVYFFVEIDIDFKEVYFERIVFLGKKFVEVEFVVEDRFGVLVKISGFFGKYGINIFFNESEELFELGFVVIVVIVDVSGSRILFEEFKRVFMGLKEVKELILREVE